MSPDTHFYNTGRPHSSLDDKTPDEAYWQKLRPGTQVGGITMKAFHLISAAPCPNIGASSDHKNREKRSERLKGS